MVPVLCMFDNEEIGSETKQGAASVFLPETLAAISEALGLSAADALLTGDVDQAGAVARCCVASRPITQDRAQSTRPAQNPVAA